MGRVARYKKVKNSIKTFGQFMGSEKKDDPASFGEIKKTGIDGFFIEEESKSARMKRSIAKATNSNSTPNKKKRKESSNFVHGKEGASSTAAPSSVSELKMKRQPGESLLAFNARVDRESREILARKVKKQTKTSQKKKSFLDERKKRNKDKRAAKMATANKKGVKRAGQSQAKDNLETRRVGVHDVAVRPPEFKFSNERFQQFKALPPSFK